MSQERPNFGLTAAQQQALHHTLVWIKDYFDNAPKDIVVGGHGFDKTMRQAGMAAELASGEGHPIFLPVLTAMAMDVGRVTEDPRSKNYHHGELSRELVEATLFPSLEILTPEDQVVVGNAIEDHSKLNENVRGSYVVEIAMDADRNDCLGTLGPLRSAGWFNLPIILPNETSYADTTDGQQKTLWHDMQRQLEWFDMLWTPSAKEIARPRVLAYREYLEELQREVFPPYEAFNQLMAPPPSFGVTEEEQQVLQQTFAQIRNNGEYSFDKVMRQAGMAVIIASKEGYPVFLPALRAMKIDARKTIEEQISTYSTSVLNNVAVDAVRLDHLGALGPLWSASLRFNAPLVLPEDVSVNLGSAREQTLYQDMISKCSEGISGFYTNAAIEIAAQRVKYLEGYLERLKEEAAFSYNAFRNLGI